MLLHDARWPSLDDKERDSKKDMGKRRDRKERLGRKRYKEEGTREKG